MVTIDAAILKTTTYKDIKNAKKRTTECKSRATKGTRKTTSVVSN